MNVHVHVHVHAHAHVHVCACVAMCMRTCTCTCTCMCVGVGVGVYTSRAMTRLEARLRHLDARVRVLGEEAGGDHVVEDRLRTQQASSR